jgi:Putative zinc- or iron-chelating domain
MMQQKFDSVPGEGEVACSAGCDHCCRTLPVMVSPVEVFTLIHRVRATHGADRALRERLMGPAAAETGGATSPPGSLPPGPLTPCPLLGTEGLCIVYSSRPLACRGCVSADAAACSACGEDRLVPRSTVHQLGAAAMVKGVCDALDGLGLASAPVELRAALSLASRDSEAERRWFRGEDVFATPASREADRER